MGRIIARYVTYVHYCAVAHFLQSVKEYTSVANTHTFSNSLFSCFLHTEAQFHTVVDRKPLRLENEAWQRVMVASSESESSMDIPSEFQAWVNAPTNTAALKTEEPTLAPADATA